jgi:hypothetical protein
MTSTWTRILAVAFLCAVRTAPAVDFNGDGKQDLVWRNHSGNPVVWQMNGLTVTARNTLSTALDSGSAIVGSGNFYGSGAGAILWADSLNRLSLWRVSNGSIQQACLLASGIDPGWSFLGIGDLNADGRDDVLWRAPDGSVHVYLMNGCGAIQTITLAVSANPGWQFLGTGDVDTKTDAAIFWRDGGSGDVVLWRVKGTSVQATTLPAGSYASWNVAAVADFDGDGSTDLLWRSGDQTALWLINGTKFTAVAVTAAAGVFTGNDALFSSGFDTNAGRAPPLSSDWAILGATDVNGDGRADVVLADGQGNVSIWQMQGASIQASGLVPPSGDMPYTALTGWRMAMDRPTVTKVNDQVTVAWQAVNGSPAYTVYASATGNPANGGVPIAATGTSLSFGRNDSGYADKRYFALSAGYLGVQLPPSPEAYIVEFDQLHLYEWGAMAIGDINHDGCVDVLDALGDCHGNFTVLDENAMGLAALWANNRQYRDLRYADLDGDGIEDLISSVYTSLDDANSQVLFFRGIGNNQFVEDPAFTALGIRGYGETIVVADFNGDGYLDIFLPQYSMDSPAEHSWLLLNDGHGHFTDVADLTGIPSEPAANLALRSVPSDCRIEGTQALDINGDGRIDLYAANHLFLNQGNDASGVPHFLDTGPRVLPSNYDPQSLGFYHCTITTPSTTGLPAFHDEGAKFVDIDNSGQLALVLNDGESSEEGGKGLGVFKFDGIGQFVDHSDIIPHFFLLNAWGLQAADVDGDGLPDIVLPGGCMQGFQPVVGHDNCNYIDDPRHPQRLLVNRNGQFVLHDFFEDSTQPSQLGWSDLLAYADFDRNGTVDLVTRLTGPPYNGLTVLMNRATSSDAIVVSVVGAHDEHNQQGRVVHASPVLRPGINMTQVVDGGSGYLSNGQYDLLFPTPYEGAYTISVRFAAGTWTVTAHRGDHVTLRANGTYSIQ